MLIKSGVLLHGPTDHEAVVFDRTNKPTFAIFHLRGTVVDGARSYRITLYNSWPRATLRSLRRLRSDARGGSRRDVCGAAAAREGKYRVLSLQPMTVAIPVTFGLGFSSELREPLPQPGDVVDVHYAIEPPVRRGRRDRLGSVAAQRRRVVRR